MLILIIYNVLFISIKLEMLTVLILKATLGMVIQHPAFLCPELNEELLKVAKSVGCQSVLGKTMCTYDFYEGV